MICYQYFIEKRIGTGAYYVRLIRSVTEEQGELIWIIHIAPRWRAYIGHDTDRQCIDFFQYPNLYCTLNQ